MKNQQFFQVVFCKVMLVLTALLETVCTILGVTAEAADMSEDRIRCYDLNGDKKVSIADVVLVTGFVAEDTSVMELLPSDFDVGSRLDMNRDGLISILDVRYLLNFILENLEEVNEETTTTTSMNTTTITETTTTITKIVTQDVTEVITEVPMQSRMENLSPIYNMYGELVDRDNCLYMNGEYIQIAYGPANSSNLNLYDVVQDTELFSDQNNIFLFGHAMRGSSEGSFIRLSKTKVGNEIILINNGVVNRYLTIRSERGRTTQDNTKIESYNDGIDLVHFDFGCETIRLITCHGYDQYDRWVVIAKKIE